MVGKWKDFDYFHCEPSIPHPNVKGIFGQISILNRKDLWNDFSDLTRIGIKFQPNDKSFQIKFFEITYVYKNWRKKNWGEKNFLDPLSETTGARNGKNAKNGQF